MVPPLDAGSAALWVAIGTGTGIINTLAGGGSLITLPALIFWGLPATYANATNRIGVGAQSAVALLTFARAGQVDLRRVGPRLAVILPGSFIGASLASTIDPEGLRSVIGAVLVALLAIVVIRPERWLTSARAAPIPVQLVGFFIVGLYGGFLQAGVGLFLLTTSTLLSGENLVEANVTKTLMVGGLTGPALAVFFHEGLVHLPTGGCLALGSVLGGYLGARLTLYFGAPLVRALLIIVVVLSATRLLDLW